MTQTIQQAVETIIAAVPGAPFAGTVDTIKTGDASQPVRGVVVTFMATAEVIEKAVQLGANFIITHEPTFYNHPDKTEWLGQHAAYQAKRKLIDENRIVIWRFHDYIHSLQPDPIGLGLLEQLGWEKYAAPDEPHRCTIPPLTLRELGLWVMEHMGLDEIRMVGVSSMICRKIALWPGAPGFETQIGALGQAEVDVLITGEISEWETSEFVRDAVHLGFQKGLIITGHAASEEAGMKRIIPWLQERLPGTIITFIPTGRAIYSI